MSEALPVTLLTGFLGSGKTTLLNYFLQHKDQQPVAIVENEFGPVNIDGALLYSGENINVVELSSGCVCCSVRGEFSAALNDMLDQRSAGQMQFERLIIETTGLADPGPIIQGFFVDERLREALRLDAVVVLADAEHICTQLDEHAVAAAQIGFADRILLTKTDRVKPEQKTQALARIHNINRKADIFAITNGECGAELWLDLNAFELNDNIELARGFHVVHQHHHEHEHEHEHQLAQFQAFDKSSTKLSWNDAISAHVFEAGWLDLQKIGAFMESCIERYGNDMLRYKGVLAIDQQPQRLIVQGVHKVVGFDYGSAWQPNEQPGSRLVIIGRYLPIEQLRLEFAVAAAQPTSPSA